MNISQLDVPKIEIDLFQVCRNGRCVDRAVQIINQGSFKCMHAKLADIVTMSNCREGTYPIQRFTLLQRDGTHQYYIVREGTRSPEFVVQDYCMAVEIRKPTDAYLRMQPCSFGNESFLWTLHKTAKNDSLEFTIFNQKHRLYLSAKDSRIHLLYTNDTFSSNFAWHLFDLEAQEPATGSLNVHLNQSKDIGGKTNSSIGQMHTSFFSHTELRSVIFCKMISIIFNHKSMLIFGEQIFYFLS